LPETDGASPASHPASAETQASQGLRSDFRIDISRILKSAPAELIGREEETKLLNDARAKVRSGEHIRAGCIRQPPLLDYTVCGDGTTHAFGLYATMMDIVARDNGLQVDYIGLRFHEMLRAVENRQVDLRSGPRNLDQKRR
jgi:hypothetical protein